MRDTIVAVHKGKKINITNPNYFINYGNSIKSGNLKTYIVPIGENARPDLLSFSIFGNSSNWEILLYINNISDPVESLISGNILIVPKI